MRQVCGVIKYAGKASQYAGKIIATADSALGKPQYILKRNNIIWGWKMRWIKPYNLNCHVTTALSPILAKLAMSKW